MCPLPDTFFHSYHLLTHSSDTALIMSVAPSSVATLVSVSSGVENDLRSLVAEGKKKVADLQASAERAIQKLRFIAQQAPTASPPSTPKSGTAPAELPAETLQSDLILRPLLLVTSAKQPKLTLIALSAIQKLLTLSPLNPRFISTIVGTLRIQAETDDPAVQLKILQTLLLCISPVSIACGEILTGSLLQALGVCFRLFSSKNGMIANTSSAALRQVIQLLYDKIQTDAVEQEAAVLAEKRSEIRALSEQSGEEMKSSNTAIVVTADEDFPLAELPPEQLNGFLLYRDLCILANASEQGRTQARWLTLSSTVSPSLCIELLEGIVSGHKRLFGIEPTLFTLLKRDTCVLISRLLRSTFDFPLLVRLLRCVSLIVRHCHPRLRSECEVFLTLLIKMLGQEFPMWQHVLVLEALVAFTQSASLVYFLYSRYDDANNNKIIASVCHSLSSFISSSPLPADASGVLGYKLSGGKKPVKGLESLNDEEPPVWDEVYRVSLSIESIIQIVNGLANLAALSESDAAAVSIMMRGSSTTTTSEKTEEKSKASLDPMSPPPSIMSPTANSSSASAFAPDDDELSPDRDVLKRLVLSCWQSILAALSSLLAKTNEEAQVQHLLMAYQSFTNTCGMLQLIKPRDALLSSLCSFALKKQFPRDESIQELMKDVLTPGADGQLAPLLTAKNIQAYKALFNIAHCLGSYLGSAWSIVLETFHQLDTVIQLTQEIQTRMMRGGGELKEEYSKILPNASEIVIMSTALSRLFESTRYLDDAAVTQVLSALGALSLTTLAAAGDASSLSTSSLSGGRGSGVDAGGGVSNMRIFSLANLIATIEHNMFRISSAKLWSLGINHLTCVITHRDPRIRAYGVEALRKLTILALGKKPTGPPLREDKKAADDEKSVSAAANIFDDPDAFQLSLLSPLTELYIKSRYDDTRLQLLQALHSILQAAGQSMSAGWTTILDWLSQVCEIGGTPGSPRGADGAVPTGGKGDAAGVSKEKVVVSATALITLGFNSIQLIVNDFIDSIPLDRIPLLISTIGQYCVQRHDTNISFTSIGLLWRVSDYIARIVGVHIVRRRASVADLHNGAAVSATANGSSTENDVLTEAAADRLMLSLFTQLHSLSMDSRPEVRNSAVKTFSSTLVAHGARMRADACIQCLQSFQLPLLASLLEANPEREKESVGAASHELGRDKDSGRSVMMMVHHSRDTAQKQWDETRVFALQGAARVLKVYVEAWGQLQEFVELWPAYLTYCREAIGHRSQEVALAAVNALQEVMGAPSTQASFIDQPTLWLPVLPIYKQAVEYGVTQAEQLQTAGSSDTIGGSTTLATLSPEAGWKHWMKVYTQLVSTWQLLVASAPRLFSDTDLTLLLDLTQKLTTFSPPTPKRKGIIDSETPLQAASLRLIEHLTPLPHQYPMLLSHLLSCLRPAADQSTLSPFTRKALTVLDAMYTGAPAAVRAEQFTLVVGVLSGVLRATDGWVREGAEGVDEVVNAFVHVVEVGLPAAAEAGLAGTELWTSLLDSLSSMLSPSSAAATASPPTVLPPLFLPSVPVVLPARFNGAEQQLWEHLQISLIGLLVRHVLPSSLACPLDVQWQLILLLNLGYASLQPAGSATLPPGPLPNELLSHACMMGLFALVSLSSQPESAATCYLRVGVLCVPLLLHRCHHVLAGFVADQRVVADLPQSRREEMGFVLRELHSLSVHPQVSAVLTAPSQLDYVKQLQALDELAESAVGWRRHVLTLFPVLCDCVCVAELELRELLRDLLHQAAGEMGLEKHRSARKQSAAVREAVEEIVASAKAI